MKKLLSSLLSSAVERSLFRGRMNAYCDRWAGALLGALILALVPTSCLPARAAQCPPVPLPTTCSNAAACVAIEFGGGWALLFYSPAGEAAVVRMPDGSLWVLSAAEQKNEYSGYRFRRDTKKIDPSDKMSLTVREKEISIKRSDRARPATVPIENRQARCLCVECLSRVWVMDGDLEKLPAFSDVEKYPPMP